MLRATVTIEVEVKQIGKGMPSGPKVVDRIEEMFAKCILLAKEVDPKDRYFELKLVKSDFKGLVENITAEAMSEIE